MCVFIEIFGFGWFEWFGWKLGIGDCILEMDFW